MIPGAQVPIAARYRPPQPPWGRAADPRLGQVVVSPVVSPAVFRTSPAVVPAGPFVTAPQAVLFAGPSPGIAAVPWIPIALLLGIGYLAATSG